jgi:hypothetical protein
MEKAHKMRMKPKIRASTEVLVPLDIRGVENDPAVDGMVEDKELSPDSIKHYTQLKWECLTMGVSLAVLQYPFPKPLLCKQLKENLSLHQIIISLSRQKKKHLKKHGKQEPLCAISLDEYELMTNAQQFAFEKEIEAEQSDKLLPLPQPPVRARTDARTNPIAQRATQLRSVLARVYAFSIQNQITTTVP